MDKIPELWKLYEDQPQELDYFIEHCPDCVDVLFKYYFSPRIKIMGMREAILQTTIDEELQHHTHIELKINGKKFYIGVYEGKPFLMFKNEEVNDES